MTPTLNPGSEEAVAMGCKCASIDNHYGKGLPLPYPQNPVNFWINAACPIHGSYDLADKKEAL